MCQVRAVAENMGCQNSSGARAIAHLLHHVIGGTVRAPALVALVGDDLLSHETLDFRCNGSCRVRIRLRTHRLPPALPPQLLLPSPRPWDWHAESTHHSP